MTSEGASSFSILRHGNTERDIKTDLDTFLLGRDAKTHAEILLQYRVKESKTQTDSDTATAACFNQSA